VVIIGVEPKILSVNPELDCFIKKEDLENIEILFNISKNQ
jgi:hypothetical protein